MAENEVPTERFLVCKIMASSTHCGENCPRMLRSQITRTCYACYCKEYGAMVSPGLKRLQECIDDENHGKDAS